MIIQSTQAIRKQNNQIRIKELSEEEVKSEKRGTNQLELKNIGSVLDLRASLDGLVTHERIVHVPHVEGRSELS